jgi:putative pyruvate formate lyase activating enzyme
VDRLHGPAGRCQAGATARFFSSQTEAGDELELVPTFAIALSGCNWRCSFCVSGESSWDAAAGWPMDSVTMGRRAEAALGRGARTVMILGGEPTIYPASLLELVAVLPEEATLVLKTNAGFSVEVRSLLEGLFDVWLPDLKFGNDTCARRLAGLRNHWATVTENLLWMARDCGRRSGAMIVRHLLMPGHVDCCWEPAARWLSAHLPDARTSLRDGYWPAWHAARHPELRRTVPPGERDRAWRIARECRLPMVTE